MNRISTMVRVFADGGQALESGEDAGDGEDCGRGSKEPYLESAAACSGWHLAMGLAESSVMAQWHLTAGIVAFVAEWRSLSLRSVDRHIRFDGHDMAYDQFRCRCCGCAVQRAKPYPPQVPRSS
jgi:hypothetical protein